MPPSSQKTQAPASVVNVGLGVGKSVTSVFKPSPRRAKVVERVRLRGTPMTGIIRRRFIQSAAALGALGMADALGAGPALAAMQGPPSKLSDIDHFIILMKENRSFDHYFGSLRGVRGFDDPTAKRPDGGSIFRQPDPKHPDGYIAPFALSTHKTSGQHVENLSHAWSAQHASWN